MVIAHILVEGLVAGGVYAILAVGFSLIYGVARILNMAHTAFYMVTAYFILITTTMLHFPTLPSLGLSIAISTILGILCFRLFLDRVKEHESAVMIISVALAMIFQEVFLLAFGGVCLGVPPFIQGFIELIGIRVSYQHLFAIGSTLLILISLWLLLSKTKIGTAILAVSQDREIANLMGINVSRISTIVMGISVALAGLAGAVVAPIYMLSPFMWQQPLVIILAAVVLGGLGSIGASVIGSLILAYSETIVTILIPGGSFLKGAVSLSFMVVVLIIRPEGLFGVVFEEERL